MATETSKETVSKPNDPRPASGNPAGLRLTSSPRGPVPRDSAARDPKGTTSQTITKKDLIDRISERTNLKRQDVKLAVQEFLEQVMSELRNGNRLEFRDFGVFEIKYRAPRVAQNPKTLERVDVPAKRTVKFKIGRLMRESLEQRGEPAGAHLNGSVNGSLNGNHAAGSPAQAPKSKSAQ